MGNYIFSTDVLVESLKIDAGDEGSVHDMGGNIIRCSPRRTGPRLRLSDNEVPGTTDRDRGYWRDVGSLDAYHDAPHGSGQRAPGLQPYNRKWPILTHLPPLPLRRSRLGGNAHESMVGRRFDHLRRPCATVRAVVRRAGGEGASSRAR